MELVAGTIAGISHPRPVSVQAAGCAPVVKAFDSGAVVTESDRVVVFNTATGLKYR